MGVPRVFPDEKLVVLVGVFEKHGIPYAVGGAISLIYWSEPRATVDIDVNVFLRTGDAERVANLLASAGITSDTDRFISDVSATAQVRVDYDGTPLDLFFNNLPFHESCAERKVRVPFGEIEMNVLSAEDLVICKAMFNRNRDWPDIEQVMYVQGKEFDLAYTLGWLTDMLGDGAEQVRRINEIGSEVAAWEATLGEDGAVS